MKIEFTNEIVFSFSGPNLCILGNENDFKSLAFKILELTDYASNKEINLSRFPGIEVIPKNIEVIFSSEPYAKFLGKIDNNRIIIKMDSIYWERLFIFFVMMSWDKQTHYLNYYESGLVDLQLEQEFNLICSSEF